MSTPLYVLDYPGFEITLTSQLFDLTMEKAIAALWKPFVPSLNDHSFQRKRDVSYFPSLCFPQKSIIRNLLLIHRLWFVGKLFSTLFAAIL